MNTRHVCGSMSEKSSQLMLGMISKLTLLVSCHNARMHGKMIAFLSFL